MRKPNLPTRGKVNRMHKTFGQTISPQCLNAFERDQRTPTSDGLIEQLAAVLGISEYVLYHRVGRMPRELRDAHADDETVVEAWTVFSKTLRGEQR